MHAETGHTDFKKTSMNFLIYTAWKGRCLKCVIWSQGFIEEGRKQGLAQGIAQGIERGIEQGIERGIERGIEEGTDRERLQNIRSMMRKLKVTASEAMDIIEIPAEEQPKYLKLLSLPQ